MPPTTTGGTTGIAVADFNGDGWLDFVTADSTGNRVTVYQNIVGINLGAQQFVPTAPCRVIDTRTGLGGIIGPLRGPGTTGLPLAGNGTCGQSIPANVAAYSLNVTVIPQQALPYLQIWPAGALMPGVSIVNSPDGRTRANALIVAGGNGGWLNYSIPSSTTDLVVDINGYFLPASPFALAFYPVTPCRVFDTRGADGPLGGPYIQGEVGRNFPIPDSNCNIPREAQAYSMNLTAVPYHGEPLGYLTVWATGSQQPDVSTLNNPTATIVANGAIVPAGGGGNISVYASNDTHLVGDINGYFASVQPGGLSFYTSQPCRALDTRGASGAFTGEATFNIADSPCAPPSTAQAYALNATAVPNGALNYLTLWPDGEGRPTVSTLNAVDGQITSNMAIVGTSNGSIDAYASGLTNLILDLYVYFAP